MYGIETKQDVNVAWSPQPGAQVRFLTCPIYECLFESSRGAGKRISDRHKIYTNKGWKLVREVTKNDKLCTIDGSFTDILGIYHKEKGEMYKFTFIDGATTYADIDHLWTVREYNGKWETKSTKEILESKKKLYIPLLEKSLEGNKWSGESARENYNTNFTEDYKFPKGVLEADRETRIDFLQYYVRRNAMVVDDKICVYDYNLNTMKMARKIILSLGGYSIISKFNSTNKLDIYHCNKFCPFPLKSGFKFMYAFKRMREEDCAREIVSVEKVEDEPATCFKVAHKSHLFLIEDYVLTHNTDALLMDFAQFVGKGFGEAWKGILFRETFPDLKDVIAKSNKWFRKIFPDAVYNSSDHCWKFATGEVLYFRHARTVKDYWSYHGHEYPWVGWEELTKWATPDLYLMMMSICRSSDKGVPRHYRATCNPWGAGHSWVKKRFIDRGPAETIITDVLTEDEQKELGLKNITGDRYMDRCYVHGDRNENRALMDNDKDYELNLVRGSANEATKKAWIEGDWNIMSGGMFNDIWDKDIHLIRPFNIPNSWRVNRAFDYGSTKPFSIGWWAVSDGTEAFINGKPRIFPKGTIILIGEWYGWERGNPNVGLKMTSSKIGAGLKEREDMLKKKLRFSKVYPGPGDASIFGSESDGDSIAKKINHGYYGRETRNNIFVPSNKKPGTRKIRWAIIRDRLTASVENSLEDPHLYVFDTCLEGLARTIVEMPRDEKDPDDIETKFSEDHALDMTGYEVLYTASQAEMKRFTTG